MNAKTVNEIFAYNLKNRLFERRMTQQDLARKLNVSTATVSKWASGEIVPRPKNVALICKWLNCTTDDLMTDHTKEVLLDPADIIAEAISERPLLMTLFLVADKASDEQIKECIEVLKK